MPPKPGDGLDDETKMLVCAYLTEEVRALAVLATELNLSKEAILCRAVAPGEHVISPSAAS